jgi:hypothetical protein
MILDDGLQMIEDRRAKTTIHLEQSRDGVQS